jgi:hypothetical protein
MTPPPGQNAARQSAIEESAIKGSAIKGSAIKGSIASGVCAFTWRWYWAISGEATALA